MKYIILNDTEYDKYNLYYAVQDGTENFVRFLAKIWGDGWYFDDEDYIQLKEDLEQFDFIDNKLIDGLIDYLRDGFECSIITDIGTFIEDIYKMLSLKIEQIKFEFEKINY